MAGEYITPGDWMKAIRTMRFGTRRGVRAATIRAVAATIASYAEYENGTRIFPGVALLAVHSEVDYRTARTVLAILRDDLALVSVVRGGRRRGHADEYRLSMPEDITERVVVLSPVDVEAAAERIREANRRRPKADSTGAGDTRTAPVENVAESPVRVSPTPVPQRPDANRTGVAGTDNSARTGVAGTDVRVSPTPPTESVPRHLLPNHSDQDLIAAVTVSRATPPSQDPDLVAEEVTSDTRWVGRATVPWPARCPHNLRAIRRADGTSSCAACRQEAVRSHTAVFPTVAPRPDPDGGPLAQVIQFAPRSAS